MKRVFFSKHLVRCQQVGEAISVGFGPNTCIVRPSSEKRWVVTSIDYHFDLKLCNVGGWEACVADTEHDTITRAISEATNFAGEIPTFDSHGVRHEEAFQSWTIVRNHKLTHLVADVASRRLVDIVDAEES